MTHHRQSIRNARNAPAIHANAAEELSRGVFGQPFTALTAPVGLASRSP